MIIGLGFSPDQSRQINPLFTGRSFAEGQATASAEQPTVKAPEAAAVALQPAERGCWTEPSQ